MVSREKFRNGERHRTSPLAGFLIKALLALEVVPILWSNSQLLANQSSGNVKAFPASKTQRNRKTQLPRLENRRNGYSGKVDE